MQNPPIGLLLVPMPLLVGIVVALVAGLVSGSWIVAVAGLVVGAAAAAALAYWFAPAIALRLLGARPLLEGGSTLLRNQLEELCARAGISEPDLYTVGPGSAAVASAGRGVNNSAIIVTDGLSDDLTVVELEAAVARELARTRSGATTVDTLAVPFLTLPFGGSGLGRRLLHWIRGGDHDARTDLEGVSITRYPPGLTAALAKMDRPDSPASVHHLWATGDSSEGEIGRYGLAERLELLHEL